MSLKLRIPERTAIEIPLQSAGPIRCRRLRQTWFNVVMTRSAALQKVGLP